MKGQQVAQEEQFAPSLKDLRQRRHPAGATKQASKEQQALTAHQRGLSKRPEASTIVATSVKQEQPARPNQRSKASSLPTASDIAKNVVQHLSAEARPKATKSPAPTRQARQAKRPPAASNVEATSVEEASTSDTTTTKKQCRKAPGTTHPRAKAALSFDSDAERTSPLQSASGGAQHSERAGGNSIADEAPEQPLPQAASKRVQGRQRKQAQPRTRAAKQLLESRQLRPRPAVAAAAPGTPPKPAEPPARQNRQASKQAAAKTPCRRLPLQECEVEGHTYHVGDCAYIVTDENFEDDSAEAEEVCEVCNRADKKRGRRFVELLECDRCLRGYHLDCLDPPLDAVPEGEWRCPICEAGEPVVATTGRDGTADATGPPCRGAQPQPLQGRKTDRQKFLSGGIDLGRIEALWRQGEDTMFRVRWYCRPEDTELGRQEHHTAREVFLTEVTDVAEVEALLRPAIVCSPSQLLDHPGDDVFVCDHMYHQGCAVFHALDDLEDEGFVADISDDDSNADEDDTFRPARPGRGRGSGSHRRCVQGGEDWAAGRRKETLGLGAAGIPAAARMRGGRTPLETARAALALTSAPGAMPCREAERAEIARFVEEAVAAGEECLGQCLYVAGVPGTGKTATVHEVMRQLRGRAESGELPAFRFVEINALRLPSPQHAYVHLYRALTGKHASPATAAEQLEALFSGGVCGAAPKRVTVVLVDEMDLLITKKQQVLYNLCEWPTRPGARLAVVGIANTLDLPERLLPRIASRLGGRRVVFQPYKRDQLKRIVEDRLRGAGVCHLFHENAIKYAAGKVAAVSGDARRALELCRKAAEIAEEEQASAGVPSAVAAASCDAPTPTQPSTPPKSPGAAVAAATASDEHRKKGEVVMGHVDAAIREMFRAVHMRLLGNVCRLEKILLAALVIETRATGRSDAVLRGVATRMQQLCSARGEPEPYCGDVVSAAVRLGAKRLILAGPGAHRLAMRLALNVSTDDVVTVLKSETTIPWMSQLNL
ncbi:g9306 [Coccomyxa elongata]